MSIKPLADVCFEVSFESGNKVGGIYTVLVSKSKQMKKYYDGNYYAIGFYNPNTYLKEFEPSEVPENIKKVFDELKALGIKCLWGRWITANDTNIILVDSQEFMNAKKDGVRNIDAIKKELWEEFKIDSIRMGFDYDEPLAWATAAGILIEKLIEKVDIFKGKKVVAHFHEWLSSGGLLYLLKKNAPVGLIFTTHATRLGRSKSSSGEDLIGEIDSGLKSKKILDDKEAYKFNLEGQHLLEKTSAQKTDVFTTVSDIVGLEAKYILGKEPDIITINCIDFDNLPSTRTLELLHDKYRKKINNFLKAYFSPYYLIELKGNIVFFISGRYEFSNKGVDVFIDALSLLNKKLKKEGVKENVFAFILIPTSVKGPVDNLLESIVYYERIEDLVDDQLFTLRENIIDTIVNGEKLNLDKVLEEDFMIKLKILSKFYAKLTDKEAPLSAFKLSQDDDQIINYLKDNDLKNKKDDPVKIIFYPAYLSVTDGLLSMDYNEFVIGGSMGFFPSRYEPWGYTPFEASALRTLALTTDVAGFGSHLTKIVKDKEDISKRVLKIKNRSKKEISKDLCDIMEWCVKLGKQRLNEKLKTREYVENFDWKDNISSYIEAHNLAIEKSGKRIKLHQ